MHQLMSFHVVTSFEFFWTALTFIGSFGQMPLYMTLKFVVVLETFITVAAFEFRRRSATRCDMYVHVFANASRGFEFQLTNTTLEGPTLHTMRTIEVTC